MTYSAKIFCSHMGYQPLLCYFHSWYFDCYVVDLTPLVFTLVEDSQVSGTKKGVDCGGSDVVLHRSFEPRV
jgi:hypothetical protein